MLSYDSAELWVCSVLPLKQEKSKEIVEALSQNDIFEFRKDELGYGIIMPGFGKELVYSGEFGGRAFISFIGRTAQIWGIISQNREDMNLGDVRKFYKSASEETEKVQKGLTAKYNGALAKQKVSEKEVVLAHTITIKTIRSPYPVVNDLLTYLRENEGIKMKQIFEMPKYEAPLTEFVAWIKESVPDKKYHEGEWFTSESREGFGLVFKTHPSKSLSSFWILTSPLEQGAVSCNIYEHLSPAICY